MKKITGNAISGAVCGLCVAANTRLRPDIKRALENAIKKEDNDRAKIILQQLLENARVAKADMVALCQDTGMPVVFVDIGRGIDISGLDIAAAVNKGIEKGYKKGYLRDSIVADPLLRQERTRSIPCIIHFDFGPQQGLKITVMPKGFGCENKTQLKMFSPTASIGEIKNFIISVVKDAGPDACPPYTLGIGIGGSADYASLLSKKALLRPVSRRNKLKHVAQLEEELYSAINKLNIGPMGLGGRTTVFGVNILTYPTHMAGLPVAVNISCHVLRSASVILK